MTSPKVLHHDFETFSEVDIGAHGLGRYVRDPTTEVLMCAYAFDDQPVKQWIPEEGQALPAELEDSLLDERIKKVAFHKAFEQGIWSNVMGVDIPNNQWRDTMIMALYCGLPGSLDMATSALGFAEKYQKKRGGHLINTFSVMQSATASRGAYRILPADKPALWEEMKRYNIGDVEADRHLYKTLRYRAMSDAEWDLWEIDQHINQRGIPINMAMVNNACEVLTAAKSHLLAKLKTITGMTHAKSTKALLEWLMANGYEFSNLQDDNIKEAIKTRIEGQCPPDDAVLCALQIRSQISQSSVKKFETLRDFTDDDGVYRFGFDFYRSMRTGRWGARGLGAQSLPAPSREFSAIKFGKTAKGNKIVIGGGQTVCAENVAHLGFDAINMFYDRPMDVIKSALRGAIEAPEGQVFVYADLKYIENLCLGWLTGDENILDPIREGKDPYLSFAPHLYDYSYEFLMNEYQNGNKTRRDATKPVVLGCGYKLGAGRRWRDGLTGEPRCSGLIETAQKSGVVMSQDESKRAVKIWREVNHGVAQFWPSIEYAAKKCLESNTPIRCMSLLFEKKGDFMCMTLPSGRVLHYYKPQIGIISQTTGKLKNDLSYLHYDAGQWVRVSTHGGKLTQNAVQAVARDLFAHGLTLAHKRGIDIVLHSHDDMLSVVLEDKADIALSVQRDSMEDPPPWWGDLPIQTEGFITKRFLKD